MNAPLILIGGEVGGVPARSHEIQWTNPLRVLSDYVRVSSELGDGLVAQGYRSARALLVDIFNTGDATIRVGFSGVDGDPGEYDRLVPPGAGIGWSSSPPTLSADDPGPGRWDEVFMQGPWGKADKGWTFNGGSSRNKQESRDLFYAEKDRVSRAMEADLDRWSRWQLLRTYQSADAATGLPTVLLGGVPKSAVWFDYGGDIGTVTPMDTHHQTVGRLRDAYVLTRNPRALDQIARQIFWALATQDYYRADWHWPYGGIERVPGWLLTSIADAAQAFKLAGYAPLVEALARVAGEHVKLLTSIGFNVLGLPNVVAPPDAGRHIGVPFNAPWQGAAVAWGLLRVKEELGVPGSGELAERWLDYIEMHGWNQDENNPKAFDSVPHNLADQAVEGRGAGVPGIGMWAAAPLLKAGRTNSGYLAWLVRVAETTKTSGNFLSSPKGLVSLFGRAIDWSS